MRAELTAVILEILPQSKMPESIHKISDHIIVIILAAILISLSNCIITNCYSVPFYAAVRLTMPLSMRILSIAKRLPVRLRPRGHA